MRSFLVAIALSLAAPGMATARTWNIQVDATGDAATIQAGIDSAAAGDTVLVGPGTYFENLSVVNKDIRLLGEGGPEATIVDGSHRLDSVIYMSGQLRTLLIEGFTITGGVGHYQNSTTGGGGIYLDNGASPTIRNNHIVGNGISNGSITNLGGGILVTGQRPALWTLEAVEV
jgi:nitrous oxidase accessory protein NosD